MQTAIQKRATDLVEKAGMPWHEAEELALSEYGVDAAAIDELQGECCRSDILTGDDIPALIRSVLVHGSGLLARNNAVQIVQPANSVPVQWEEPALDGPYAETGELAKVFGATDAEAAQIQTRSEFLASGLKTVEIGARGDASASTPSN